MPNMACVEEPLCCESPEFRAHQRVAAWQRQGREQVPDQRMRHQVGEEQCENPPGAAWCKGSQPRDDPRGLENESQASPKPEERVASNYIH